MYAYLLYPHQVNNVVRRHIQVPTYSCSEQTVYYDEWPNSCGWEDDEFSKSEDLFFRHFSTNVEVKLIKS